MVTEVDGEYVRFDDVRPFMPQLLPQVSSIGERILFLKSVGITFEFADDDGVSRISNRPHFTIRNNMDEKQVAAVVCAAEDVYKNARRVRLLLNSRCLFSVTISLTKELSMPDDQIEIESILNIEAQAYGKSITLRDLLLKVGRTSVQEIIDELYEEALQEGMIE